MVRMLSIWWWINSISMLFIALEHPYYIVIVATTFMDNVYKLHGFSAKIIIDRDPVFQLVLEASIWLTRG
jgi:hypothetical protein